MIPYDVKEEIIRRLERAENEHNVRILMAIESGSRAWGFASPNSDYDVRFIYAHDPDWHLAVDLEERRDVIEYPITDEIDLNGWDLRKAIRLFWKSNPAFVEWIQSPIDYINRGSFKADAFNALPKIYAVDCGIHHYRSMAKPTIVVTCVRIRYRSRSTSMLSVHSWQSDGSNPLAHRRQLNSITCWK